MIGAKKNGRVEKHYITIKLVQQRHLPVSQSEYIKIIRHQTQRGRKK